MYNDEGQLDLTSGDALLVFRPWIPLIIVSVNETQTEWS